MTTDRLDRNPDCSSAAALVDPLPTPAKRWSMNHGLVKSKPLVSHSFCQLCGVETREGRLATFSVPLEEDSVMCESFLDPRVEKKLYVCQECAER